MAEPHRHVRRGSYDEQKPSILAKLFFFPPPAFFLPSQTNPSSTFTAVGGGATKAALAAHLSNSRNAMYASFAATFRFAGNPMFFRAIESRWRISLIVRRKFALGLFSRVSERTLHLEKSIATGTAVVRALFLSVNCRFRVVSDHVDRVSSTSTSNA